jgi:hypothetical protein
MILLVPAATRTIGVGRRLQSAAPPILHRNLALVILVFQAGMTIG